MSRVIIISGPPGSGKTTLGKYLAQELTLPLYSKDTIKELLFDALGAKDRAWSRQLGAASIALLYHILESHLQSDRSIIIEANFKPELDSAKVQVLLEHYQTQSIELYCFANQETLFERFKRRSEDKSRHPGHLDDKNYEEARLKFANMAVHGPLRTGQLIEIDTSNFDRVDFKSIASNLRQLLQ